MIWYISNPARYQTEVDAIAALAERESWLTLIDWRLEEGGIVCDAEIFVGAKRFELVLRYNEAFPHTPPSIFPREKEHLSSHQYVGGELCLEYGPDNWQKDLTGADMLASAYRLLSLEATTGDGIRPPPAPTRHSLTFGQNLRGSRCRLFYTKDFFTEANSAENVEEVSMRYRLGHDDEPMVVWPISIRYSTGGTWEDTSIPERLPSASNTISAYFAKCPDDFSLESYKNVDDLLDYLFGVPEEGTKHKEYWGLILLFRAEIIPLFLNHLSKEVTTLSVVPPSWGSRLHPEYAVLGSKRVGIVGCGSIGSKVAAMLARAGVENFVLADDDVFQPENLVRNELDWCAVGEHKVDALSNHLKLLKSDVKVYRSRQNFGGQESGGTLAGLITVLKSCDLLIDATAEGSAFNYVCVAAEAGAKPMLWVEVFAGGIGGLVARSRPGREPAPQIARSQILRWCHDQNEPVPFASGGGYEGGGSAPHIADDADVTVMAAHAARLAIDTLLERELSEFPCSAYMVGLRAGWIFTQPFEVFPIELILPESSTDESDVDHDEKAAAGVMGITKLIKNLIDAKAAG